MKQLQRTKPHTRKTAGESMVMVVVMLLVFFVLGASVLTAASATSAAASARVTERQSYYYARSLLDVLDESLERGQLGQSLCDAILSDLLTKNVDAVTYAADAPFTLRFTPEFSGDTGARLTFDKPENQVALTCVGTASVTGRTADGGVTSVSISLRRVEMSFTTTYHDIDTYMHVQYRGSCNVENYDQATNRGTWSKTWTVQRVG